MRTKSHEGTGQMRTSPASSIAPMLGKLLPASVISIERLGDAGPAALLPEEEAILGSVSDGRRRDFATVRTCARQALAALGVPAMPILPGPNREPQWPPGVVGSLTHCQGFWAAAVARESDVASVGIDAEVHRALPGGVVERVSLTEERRWLRLLSGTGTHWDCVLFSGKESVYKAWYPLAGRWLRFEDVVLTVDPHRSTFRARLLVPGPEVEGDMVRDFTGRFLVEHGLVVTAVTTVVRGAEMTATTT